MNGSFGHFLSNRYISIQFESANAGAHPGGPIGPSQQFAPTDITPTSLSFYGASGITTPVYQDLHPGAQQANSFDDGMRHDNPGHDVGSGRFSSTSLRPLAPATPSSSRAVRSSSRRHANGMANQGSHLPGPHFPPSVPSDSMQPGQHHASPIVGRDVNQRRRRTGPRSPSLSTHSPVQSTSVRYDPYGTIESPVEAAHGQASLPSLSLPELAALQTRSQSASYKLSSSEFSSRLEVFEEQVWYKKETRMEEPPVTAGDVFVRRNYIKKSDKTRFYTFVTINSSNGKARCLVPNGIINSQGEMHECEIEWEKRKDAVAHVCLFLDYKPYKCKCTKPGHLWCASELACDSCLTP